MSVPPSVGGITDLGVSSVRVTTVTLNRLTPIAQTTWVHRGSPTDFQKNLEKMFPELRLTGPELSVAAGMILV